ncbi:MAG: MATE family efflux transporter, partial [Oscillospiraceae bacterium]|nr:MATE family efflux transporter [Oscillospiraceae bacterium]
GLGCAAQTAILGHMSATAIAANSIAAVVFSVLSVISMSAGSSSGVLIGKTIGENRMDDIKPYTVTLQLLFIILGTATGLLLFVLKDALISFYTVTEETKALADIFLSILSVSVIFSSYEYPAAHGIVGGGGDTKYCFFVDTLSLVCLTLPLSALSAFVFSWPPVVTFLLLKSDQFYKCIPNAIRVNGYKWIKKLTRS